MPIRKIAPLAYPYEQLHGRCAALAERIAQTYINNIEPLSPQQTKTSLLRFVKKQRGRPSLTSKYTTYPHKTTEQFWKTLQPQLSGHFMTDEAIIKCAGENHNLGVVLDKHTRYVIATRYTEKEAITIQDNINLWKTAVEIKRPYAFSTDSLKTYDKAFSKVFYTRYNNKRVYWHKTNAVKDKEFNYIMERLWNTLRERIKIMRGFKAPWSAKLLIDGYFIWYNFIRPHMTLSTTPSKQTKLNSFDFYNLIYSAKLFN